MKHFILGVFATISIMTLFGFFDMNNKPLDPKKEWIIAPRFFTGKEGVSKEEAREWMENEYLLMYKEFPGWNAVLGEPLRSGGWGTENNIAKEKGDFVLFYIYDSMESKEYYFPSEGGFGEALNKGIAKHQSTFDKLFDKYFIQDKYQNEEYLMFASSKKHCV